MTIMSPIRGGILHLPTTQEGRYSQSLERGLAILRAFSPERPWLGIAEIAETLEMSRPTTHRYASTLVALDYLEQGPGRKYRLGMRASDPGRVAIGSTPLHRLPHRCLTELRDRSACTASVAVLDGRQIVYVERARSSGQGQSEIAARLGRGSRLPAAQTALGRVLLAQCTPDEQRAALEAEEQRNGGSAPVDVEATLAELRRVGTKGFAIADQIHVAGQRCVAAALRDRSGETIAAVDVAAPKSIYSRTQASERLVPLVLSSAEQMSAHLGYAPEE